MNPLLLRGTRFRLDLPTAPGLVIRRDRVDHLGGGDFVWSGQVEGHPFSQVTLTRHEGVVSGVIDLPWREGNEVFELQPRPDGTSILVPIAADGGTCDVCEPPPVDPGPIWPDSNPATALNPAVVDIMVVYSTGSRLRYGKAGIESRILTALANAASAHTSSGIHVIFNLVHLAEVDDGDSLTPGSAHGAINRLYNPSDGWMDEVHALRNQYRADLVCLVGEYTSVAGIAWLMDRPSLGFAEFAFSASASDALANYTLHHEIGHNLGNQHDRASANSNGAYPFSFGFRHCATDGTAFRTIMSYICPIGVGPRVNQISSPNVLVNGVPAGISYETDPANSADNVRSMNLTGPLAQQFRTGTAAPAAPANLTAAVAADSSVQLAWQDNSLNAAGFRLERSSDQATWTVVATLAAGLTGFTDDGLTPEAMYFYRVRAYNGGGFSPYSDMASVLLSTSPPAAPSDLTATAINAFRLDLAWTDQATSEQGFEVQRASEGGAWELSATLPANTTTWSDTQVVTGTSYSYRVRAFNSLGASPWSNEASATPEEQPPVAPSNLAAAALSASQIQLTWSDNASDETSQQLERSSDGVVWVPLTAVAANATSHLDSDLTPQTGYFYRLRACNAVGCSAFTPAAQATTLPTPPAAPSGLSAMAFTQTMVSLAWTDHASNETGFKIERALDGVVFSVVATVGADTTAFLATGLTAATTYHFRVRAANSGGDSAASNVASVTTLPNPPAPPSGLTATAASQTQINLAWTNEAANATGFFIQRSADGVGWNDIASVPATATTYNSTDLAPGTTWHYRVRAYNTGGESPFSNTASATTWPTPPAAPTGLTATAVAQTQINLAWTDAAANETGFRVERSTAGGPWQFIAALGADATSFEDTGLAAGTSYAYRVQAYNQGGNSPWSSTAAATPTGPTLNPPLNLAAVAISYGLVDLTWTDNNTIAEGFEIRRSTDGQDWMVVARVAANLTTCRDAGLAPLTTYQYRVWSFAGASLSAAFVQTAVTTPAFVAPTAAQNFTSIGTEDGYLLESSETSDLGGAFKAGEARVGDDSSRRQFKSIFSFDTSPLPDQTTVLSALLRLNVSGITGVSPWTTHGACLVDVKGATGFGGLPALAKTDFEAPADAVQVAALGAAAKGQWSEGWLNPAGRATVNRTGRTQFRVYFASDDDNDNVNDYVKFLTGTAAAALRPQLIVTYEVMPTAVAAPDGLVAEPLSVTEIGLKWVDNASNETGFKIERSLDGLDWWEIARLNADLTAFTDSGLVQGQRYVYRVLAYNDLGVSPASNEAAAVPANPPIVQTFTSINTEDGWILESGENTSVGGSLKTGTAFAGDDRNNKQYVSVFSFDTAALPDDAIIASAKLRLRIAAFAGTSPWQTHGACRVDLKGGTGFGGSTALATGDFAAPADVVATTTMSAAATAGQWSEGSLSAAGLTALNKLGKTQFRVYFQLDDNNNKKDDYVSFSTGGAAAGSRPELIIEYFRP